VFVQLKNLSTDVYAHHIVNQQVIYKLVR